MIYNWRVSEDEKQIIIDRLNDGIGFIYSIESMTNQLLTPLISVIVPVYNAEKYLDRSINSIINQTYDNLDIILIDDGSKDSSKMICEKFALYDARIRVFSHSNSGQGFTRRFGIHEALGDYIAFVDADDYIMPTMYELMYRSMINDHADVVVCQFNYEKKDGYHSIVHMNDDELLLGVHNSIDFSHNIYKGGYQNGLVIAPWNKLYKKSLLFDADFSGYIGEDEEMNDYVFSNDCTVVVIPNELYYWCQNPTSTTNDTFSSKRWHYFEMLNKRIDRFVQDSYMVRETKYLFVNLFIEYYYKAKINSIEVPVSIFNQFKKLFFSLVTKGEASLKFIIRVTVFIFTPKFYKIIFLKGGMM